MTGRPSAARDRSAQTGRSAALIVDNPLRDIDGVTMLAWEMTRRGWETYLVPMYDQMFAIERLQPDLVVANYVRPNNVGLLREYRRRGAAVLIVDTEGAAGQNADEFVDLLAGRDLAANVDGYCVWGERQLAGFLRAGLLPATRVRSTGCPRYDIAAPQWRSALPRPSVDPGYILINTNLAGAFPRFSSGVEDERSALIGVGMDPDHVDRRLRDEVIARNGLIALIKDLAATFPETKFVLRPHPFESDAGYRQLEGAPNFSIHQEGTSLEWLSAAALLIHLNCSTAVEAVMLGREAFSPQWLDTPALHIEGPAAVSWQMADPDALKLAIASVLSGAGPTPDAALNKLRADIIRDGYLAIDGETSARIANFADEVVGWSRPALAAAPLRIRVVQIARRIMGPRLWLRAKALRTRSHIQNYQAKQFDSRKVASLLERLSDLVGEKPPQVENLTSMVASGAVLRVSPPDESCSGD